jgi:outer membrane murein-binding lipoprotein Lpp
MNRDKQNRITIVRRQLPKLIDNQMEEQVIKHLEELETLSDRDDVYKILQNNVLPQVIYNRIPWLYGVFIRNARSSKLCAFLADDLAIYPLRIRELKNDLEKEKENHEATKRQKTIPKWILIIAIAVTGIATIAGAASIAAAYNKIQPYEQEIQQLKETIQINQGEIQNLQAKLNELQAQVEAGEKAVVQAKQILKESEDLKRKNVALNNRLYQIKRTIPCRIFGCQ